MTEDVRLIIARVHIEVGWQWLASWSLIHALNMIGRLGEPIEAATAAGYQGA